MLKSAGEGGEIVKVSSADMTIDPKNNMVVRASHYDSDDDDPPLVQTTEQALDELDDEGNKDPEAATWTNAYNAGLVFSPVWTPTVAKQAFCHSGGFTEHLPALGCCCEAWKSYSMLGEDSMWNEIFVSPFDEEKGCNPDQLPPAEGDVATDGVSACRSRVCCPHPGSQLGAFHLSGHFCDDISNRCKMVEVSTTGESTTGDITVSKSPVKLTDGGWMSTRRARLSSAEKNAMNRKALQKNRRLGLPWGWMGVKLWWEQMKKKGSLAFDISTYCFEPYYEMIRRGTSEAEVAQQLTIGTVDCYCGLPPTNLWELVGCAGWGHIMKYLMDYRKYCEESCEDTFAPGNALARCVVCCHDNYLGKSYQCHI